MATGFDEAAFRQKVEQVLAGLYERTATEAQRLFDAVFEARVGKNSKEAEQALKKALSDRGVRLQEGPLARAAEAISEGRHITLADEGIRVEPLSRRNVVAPGPTVKVLFTATNKEVDMQVHCVDSETDEIGVLPMDYPATGPHMIVHAAGEGEKHSREYEPSSLGKVALLGMICPAPE